MVKYCDTSIDLMIEQAIDAEWERQNASEPDEEKLYRAWEPMRKAVDSMYKVTDELATVCKALEGTCMEDRVISLLNDLEDYEGVMKKYRDAFERGEKA